MIDFVKHVGEKIIGYPRIKFNSTFIEEVREKVLKELKLTGMNQLRDRLEGQKFLDNSKNKIGAVRACQKYKGESLLDLTDLNLKEYVPEINHNGEIVRIEAFNYGELPRLTSEKQNDPRIFVICLDESSYAICGYASADVINQGTQKSKSISSLTKENFIEFIAFDKLETIL